MNIETGNMSLTLERRQVALVAAKASIEKTRRFLASMVM